MSNSKFKIGSLTLENNVVLAPMAGITNLFAKSVSSLELDLSTLK
jgi:tRNA-dihydrouridine synthase